MKQEFIRYVDKEMNSSVVRKISSSDVRAMDVEVVHMISSGLVINTMIPGNASVMVYSQLLDRPAINGMQEYLQETEILRYLGIENIDTKDSTASPPDLSVRYRTMEQTARR